MLMSNISARTPSPLEQHRRRTRVQFTGTESQATRRVRRALSKDDEQLLASILASEMDFIDSPVFREPEAERKIYDEAPSVAKPDTSWYHPVMDDLSPGKSRTGNWANSRVGSPVGVSEPTGSSRAPGSKSSTSSSNRFWMTGQSSQQPCM